MIKSPCKNVCKYVIMSDGINVCRACYRTYDDIEVWFHANEDEKKRIIKQCKLRKKRYE
jgi:predicted Fe-S protein YdhL (DUF1289 family)